MLEWHRSELDFDDKSCDVKVHLVGSSIIRGNIVNSRLEVKFTRGAETVSVVLKEKELKVWPISQVHEIDTQSLADKFGQWVESFNTGGKFKPFVIRVAAKSKSGVSSWLLSLIKV